MSLEVYLLTINMLLLFSIYNVKCKLSLLLVKRVIFRFHQEERGYDKTSRVFRNKDFNMYVIASNPKSLIYIYFDLVDIVGCYR